MSLMNPNEVFELGLFQALGQLHFRSLTSTTLTPKPDPLPETPSLPLSKTKWAIVFDVDIRQIDKVLKTLGTHFYTFSTQRFIIDLRVLDKWGNARSNYEKLISSERDGGK